MISSFSALSFGPATWRSSALILPNSRICRETSPFLPTAATRRSSSAVSSAAEAMAFRYFSRRSSMFSGPQRRSRSLPRRLRLRNPSATPRRFEKPSLGDKLRQKKLQAHVQTSQFARGGSDQLGCHHRRFELFGHVLPEGAAPGLARSDRGEGRYCSLGCATSRQDAPAGRVPGHRDAQGMGGAYAVRRELQLLVGADATVSSERLRDCVPLWRRRRLAHRL